MTEIWKPTYCSDNYEVSNLGNVRNVNTGRLLKSSDNKGYKRVSLRIDKNSKTISIHRLVMLTFKPNENFEGAVVNHIDGNKTNNKIDNLEFLTIADNNRHARDTGLINYSKGIEHCNSKLTIFDARIIRHLFKSVPNCKTIGDIFGVDSKTILQVIKNKTWKDEEYQESLSCDGSTVVQ